MKNTIIALCTLCAVMMFTACSESPAEDSGVKPVEPTQTTAETTEKAEETTTEATTTAEPETTTEKPTETTAESKAEESSSAEVSSKAEESAKAEESQPEMNGTGGDEEMELYRLYGCWESDNGEQELHVEDNTYELLGIESYENGHLEYNKEMDAFLLANNSVDGAKNLYIQRDPDRTGKLMLIQGMGVTEFTYMSDLTPREVSYPDVGQSYDGEALTTPININFQARTDLTDVKLLKLEFIDSTQSGDMYFDTKSLLEVPTLAKGQNFAPDVEIPETIPTFGIYYRDYHGGEHYFSITQSGMDGSIILIPFEPPKG